MRRALVVGIDDYPTTPLQGCVNDATRIAAIVERHYDGSPNFAVQRLASPPQQVTRPILRRQIELLFRDDPEVALLYFSGHGTYNNLGGYLVTQDAQAYDEGVSMTDILAMANQSRAHEILVILDTCHSGAFGQVPPIDNSRALLREGIAVLTASRVSEAAVEIGGEGLFTRLVCDALEGGAADLIGDVTAASIYAYVDQALGPWDQRPLFKAHVSKLLKVRRAQPAIPPATIRRLPAIFQSPSEHIHLDPSYEPTSEPHHAEHEDVFLCLQQLNRVGLVVPVDAAHMYDAAMSSSSCRLTPLGQFYWRVASSNRI